MSLLVKGFATYHRRVLRKRRHNKGSLKTVLSENGTVKAQNKFHAILFISISTRLRCTNYVVYQISLMLNSIAQHAHAQITNSNNQDAQSSLVIVTANMKNKK